MLLKRATCALFSFVAMTLIAVAPQAQADNHLPEIPFLKAWQGSPHADAKSEAFRHWDKDGKVEKACAQCHSHNGFLDYIGADGSAAGSVEAEAATDTVVTCTTCHNKTAKKLDAVTFPSGITVSKLGSSARCMTCHQGRASVMAVDKATDGMNDDRPNKDLKFINVHYRAAGATMFGTQAKGGYEYEGLKYEGLYEHEKKGGECVACHSAHSTEVRFEMCTECHKEVQKAEDVKIVRKSKSDHDGDGDTTEGALGEIKTLEENLMNAMQVYAQRVAKSPIAYHSHNYPYFFNDTNKNGKADDDEAVFKNQYKSWTPRLLRAAYNYQFSKKDPGGYAHNPRYVMQLLYDSLADLARPTKTDISGMLRP